MSVRLVSADYVTQPYMAGASLYGKPFPPDDVKAYWSMVPAEIHVEWSAALGVFFVTRFGDYLIAAGRTLEGDEPQPPRRWQIMARDADKLQIWMRVISEMANGTP